MIDTNNFSKQDSYALCRIFKKNIQIPKSKEEAVENNNVEKEVDWVSEEQLFGYDASGTEISRGREVEDENFNSSSSDVTQGTPNETAIPDDDYQAPFTSDEANSSAHLCSLGVDFSSNLIQVQI